MNKSILLIVLSSFSLMNASYHNEFISKNGSSNTVSYRYGNRSITVCVGDITKLSRVDALVNAANSNLSWGGGVCDAIFQAAGKEELEAAVEKVLNGRTSIHVGSAVITPIPVSSPLCQTINNPQQQIGFIIHAVGPDCRLATQRQNKEILLAHAYKNSLLVADKNNLKSIAFPAISTAIFGYPAKDAAPVALDAVLNTFEDTQIVDITFVFFAHTADGFGKYIELLDEQLRPGFINYLKKLARI